ncbi:MAG: phosphate starvation-inducible protein PsiF [Betaproteobacteria bacterium]|nr:phosphate starvation-inducible protein PsiF [Betaproteobacteria bacterium]
MKKMIAAVLLALPFFATAAMAADEAKKPMPQQEKMKACNAEAKDMKGDERKAFMKNCLKKDAAPAAEMKKEKVEAAAAKADAKAADAKPAASDKKVAQQEKMKSCNAEAKDKKGDERKAFMKECLSK